MPRLSLPDTECQHDVEAAIADREPADDHLVQDLRQVRLAEANLLQRWGELELEEFAA